MTSAVYKLIDPTNNETLYVGSSENVERRYKRHLSSLRSGQHPRKDFVEWFERTNIAPELEILELITDGSTFDQKEIHWFKECKPKFYSHEPADQNNWKHSESSKSKISESLINTKSKDKMTPTPQKCKACGTTFLSKRNKAFCSSNCYKHFEPVSGHISDETLYKMFTEMNMSTRMIADQVGFSHVTVAKKINKHKEFLQSS